MATAESDYLSGFKIDELMAEYNSGIQSKRDKICFPLSDQELKNLISIFEKDDVPTIKSKLSLPADGRDWYIKWAKDDLLKGFQIKKVLYKPFDIRNTVYSGRSKGFVATY